MLRRVQRAWRELDGDQRLAGLGALALLATMFLPWYEKSVFDTKERVFVSQNVSAFGTLSFVEAAIFLVSAGVLVLLFARGERRGFHLPGGDGTVVLAAGLWAALLLLWRVFDKPDVGGAGSTVGIQWGFFFAFVAAGGLAAAGWKIRAAGRPEPPIEREDDEPRTAATQVAPRRRPVREGQQLTLEDATAPTEDAAEARTRVVPRERPASQEPLRPGEIPRAPER